LWVRKPTLQRKHMQEYRSLTLVILAIFAVTLLGAFYSPTFTEQKDYLELFFLFGAVLFIVSVLAIFASLGFSSFALYIAVFLAAVLSLYGLWGVVIVIGISYLTWGMMFTMEVILYDTGVVSAKEWFLTRYTYKTFKIEFYAFYPLMILMYILLEILPNLLHKESMVSFSPSRVLKDMKSLLV